MRRWCGDHMLRWTEVSDPGSTRHCPIDDAQSAQGWISSVDAARAAPGLGNAEGAHPDHLAWAGNSSTLAGSGSAVLGLSSDSNGGALWLELDNTVFDAATATAVLECLLWTVQGLVQAGTSRLADIDTLASTQRLQQFDEWNRPARRAPDLPPTIHAAFARSVAVHGGLVALAHRGTRIDYRTLDERAAAMTERLLAAGVQPGSVVCVALDRSIDAIVVLLGVLRAGAAYLPVDAQYPASRLEFMIADAGAALVVTCERDKHLFPQAMPIFSIDAPRTLPVEARRAPNASGEIGCASAYVMYTSGSTGEPKGIRIPHAAVLRLVLDAEYVDLGRGETVLHAAPLGFDASTFEIWGPLLNGGCCVLHDEVLSTPAGLARTIRRDRVRTAWLTAALFNSVVDADPQHLAGLRQLLIGGEALSVTHVRRALQAWPDLVLINGYGPTETTTFATTYRIPHDLPADTRSIPIGRPITATRTHVLGPGLAPLATGLIGELFIGGQGLALGYLQRPELTAERFMADPFGEPGERVYRTGDLVRYGRDGEIEFIGRADGQVKLHGHRIELAEVEARLALHTAIRACSVQLMDDATGAPRLVAYLVAAGDRPTIAALNAHLAAALPAYMLPSAHVWLDALPITANGKLDRRSLPAPATERPDLANAYLEPVGPIEASLCAAVASILGIDRCGRHDNFFELGGDSLRVVRLLARLEHDGLGTLSTASFFRRPTPAGLAQALAQPAPAPFADDAGATPRSAGADVPIAIVAMSGRFPGAADVEQFWQNLCEGRDSITVFADDTLDPSLPASLTGDPLYVKARGVIEGVELFDAGFFGMSPREADAMDPQQRLFLELCWECLERGGHAPGAAGSAVGVFAGMYNATYFLRHVSQHPDAIDKLGEFQVMLANEKDYIATRVAWRLNLTGPAISVHTACSTSLVAIAQACASLRSGQCEMALAGGASIVCPPRSGYLYQEGAMLSPDGRTRSFDARAQGTVFSDGAAVVLLKRLPDALADGDAVIAVLRGEAINNDGRDKASFTAPSVDGQAAVITAAQRAAGVDARSISYVEAHGTATPMGDPVELEGLTRAFRRTTLDPGFCRIGSLKSNVGHLVIAAGAAGVIKTALALSEEKLPPSIHFETPNPRIPFAGSPFVVNDSLTGWPRGIEPRRAGVSSFGVGGTNAHVVLEEAPLRAASSAPAGPQLLLLSARSAQALSAMASRLGDHFEAEPATNLADAAHTLQIGRSRFMHRLAVVAESPAVAVTALRDATSPHRIIRTMPTAQPALAWLLPGQGAQYAGMGAGLRASDGTFRAALDECLGALAPHLSFDLPALLDVGDADALTPTGVAQPAIFAIEYALGRAWLAQGAAPSLLIGHSVGEFAAAVFAGVMSLADAAGLVAARGALMQALPGGSMLSVRLSAEALAPMLAADTSLAAENSPNASVASGPTASIEALAATLEARGIASRVLRTSHAFHSSMMDAAVAPFERVVRAVPLHTPRIPIVSTLTGTWLTDGEATDPNYWARHLRETVRFSSALKVALGRGATTFLEVGPRQTLTLLARQHGAPSGVASPACASIGDASADETERFALARGTLWTLGFEPSACVAAPAQGRRRIRLPTYPFERKRHWLDAKPAAAAPVASSLAAPAVLVAASAATASSPSFPTPDPAPSSHTQVSVMSISADPSPRIAAVSARLRRAFEDVTGADLAEVDGSAAFVELGLDSLSLTQAATQVKKEFGVPVTFRQLMESLRSFDTLGQYVAGHLPEETAAPAPVVAAPATVAPAPVLAMPNTGAAPQDFLQQVVQQQMQLMAQQLALLGGGATPQAAAPVSANPLAPTAPVVSSPNPKPTAPAAAAVRYDVKTAFGAIARIHTQATAVTERQHARLDAFVRRYVERTKASKAYTVANRARLADPRVVNGFRPMTKEITYQIVVERSKGSRLWDLDGNEYVDVLNGFGMNMFGWQPDFVQEAVRRQLDAGYEIGPQHPLAGEVANLVCELTGFDRAALCNTGSEAVMAAVRIARTVTGRNTVVLFSGSYHGTFDEVLVRAGRDAKGIPAAPGILPGAFGDVRVLEYGTPDALEFIRAHADDLAAVLVEPVQSRRPDFRPVEFLKEVRAVASRSGTCLIFDEVITGFRAHLGGAQALFGIRADLACYGKVIGGGFPVGVVAGVQSFMDALDGGPWVYGDDSVPSVGVTYFAGTFVRHPLALAAAKASLEHLKTRQHALQTELNDATAAMADEMSAFCREVGAPLEIRRFASLWRVTWLEEHPLQDLLFAMMRSRGVHILDNFPCFLTTAHSQADIRLVIDAFKESVRELQVSEFLPCNKVAPSIVFDAARPPVPGARLGKDPSGRPAWFVPSPQDPAKYVKVNA